MKRRKILLGIATAPGWLPAVCAAQAKESVTIPLSRLAEPWSSVEFTYPAAEPVPGIVVRLRDGTLYAASRICPHQSCRLLYKTDRQEISDTFEVETGNPVLACPCHFSVFDLAQKGKVLNGPAPRGPVTFELKVAGDRVTVLKMEGER
jgi:arsenite oxidase small subunit